MSHSCDANCAHTVVIGCPEWCGKPAPGHPIRHCSSGCFQRALVSDFFVGESEEQELQHLTRSQLAPRRRRPRMSDLLGPKLAAELDEEERHEE